MNVLRETLIEVGPLTFVRAKGDPPTDLHAAARPPVIIDDEQSPATWRDACAVADPGLK
jgi:hypothetical protein